MPGEKTSLGRLLHRRARHRRPRPPNWSPSTPRNPSSAPPGAPTNVAGPPRASSLDRSARSAACRSTTHARSSSGQNTAWDAAPRATSSSPPRRPCPRARSSPPRATTPPEHRERSSRRAPSTRTTSPSHPPGRQGLVSQSPRQLTPSKYACRHSLGGLLCGSATNAAP